MLWALLGAFVRVACTEYYYNDRNEEGYRRGGVCMEDRERRLEMLGLWPPASKRRKLGHKVSTEAFFKTAVLIIKST